MRSPPASIAPAVDIAWIRPQMTLLEYAIRTRKPGWRIVLDDTVECGTTRVHADERACVLHPDAFYRTLEENTRLTLLLPPNGKSA